MRQSLPIYLALWQEHSRPFKGIDTDNVAGTMNVRTAWGRIAADILNGNTWDRFSLLNTKRIAYIVFLILNKRLVLKKQYVYLITNILTKLIIWMFYKLTIQLA